MKDHKIRSEDGMAMPLVLMVMLVIALLGATIWAYSTNDFNRALHAEKKAQAYYVARAGAESVANYILKYPNELEAILSEATTVISDAQIFETAYLGETGELAVAVKSLEKNRIEITGLATVDGVEQSVSLILATQDTFDGTIYSLGSMEFQNNVNLNGDLVSGGTVTPPKDYEGTITENLVISFPAPVFPVEPEVYSGEFLVPNNASMTVNESPAPKYEKTNIGNEGQLSFEPGFTEITMESRLFDMHNGGKMVFAPEGKTITLVVDEIVLKDIKIVGSGLVEIYVRSKVNIQTTHASVSISEDALLVLYLDKGCVMEMQANSYFEGLVYGPEATAEIGGNADFHGAMIVEQLKGRGGNFNIGGAGTEIEHKYSWEQIGFEYGGYWVVHWLQ